MHRTSWFILGITVLFAMVVPASIASQATHPTGNAGLFDHLPSPPAASIEPNSVETEMFTGEIQEYDLRLTNEGDSPLNFSIRHNIISVPRLNNLPDGNNGSAGPRRDDPGDVVTRFNPPGGANSHYNIGLAWDEELQVMWNNDFHTGRVWALDPTDDFQPNREFAVVDRCMSTALLNGHLYMVVDPQSYLTHYDRDGNRLDNVQFPFTTFAVTASQELELLFVLGNDNNVHVYQMDDNGMLGEEVGRIVYQNHIENRPCRSMLWVDLHPEGQLWFHTTTGPNNAALNHAWQFAVDTDEWVITERKQVFRTREEAGTAQHWDGLGHDGENLWASFWAITPISIIDDGVEEAKWLAYEPRAGVVEGNDVAEIALILNATSLIGGVYEADLVIDFAEEDEEDLTVTVVIEVTAAPDISAKWHKDLGFPEFIDFNRAPWYVDFFAGGEYPVEVIVFNIGTEELVIDGIETNSEVFSADPTEFVLAPREKQTVTLTFTPPREESGVYEADLEIITNDPDEEVFTIPLIGEAFLPPIIAVRPNSLEDVIDDNGFREHAMNISNEGDAPLRWMIRHNIISEPGRDEGSRSLRNASSPFRDEPGELLYSFQGPNIANQYWMPVGYDRENDAVFITGYTAGVIAVWTHDNYEDFREIRRFATPNPMDGGWYNGVIYVCNLNVNNVLRRFDIEGNNLGDLAMGYAVYGLAFDTENDLMFAREQAGNYPIHVYQMDGIDRGEEIGLIDNYRQFIANQAMNNLEWVPKHPEGQLWINQSNVQQMVQIEVDTDNWTAVREVQRFANGGANQPYDALTHDGYNMWVGGYGAANFRIYDDGVQEMYWIGYDPRDGELAANSDTDVIITLSATGLIGGEYVAELVVLSNDPETPEVVVNVSLEVIGAPDLEVTWNADWGFPDVLDWNLRYGDQVFTGGPYPMNVRLRNIGTEDLVVREVFTNNEYFIPSFQDDIILAPREVADFEVLFDAPADAPDDYNVTMTFISNDAENEEHTINLHADALMPPVIVVEPDFITEDLTPDMDPVDNSLNIANEGDAPLIFTISHRIINEPGADRAGSRSLRSAEGSLGPTRDMPGDLVRQLDINLGQHWRKSGISWDEENGLMILTAYDDDPAGRRPETRVKIVDPSNDYEIVNEWAHASLHRGSALLNNTLYLLRYNPEVDPSWSVQRFNLNGENIGNFAVRFEGPASITASQELGLLFITEEGNNNIHVLNPNGDEVGVINNNSYAQYIGNGRQRSLCWVDVHPNGQLWMNTGGHIWQVQINTGNWTAVQGGVDFVCGGNDNFDGIGHDGRNMWLGARGVDGYQILDDGVPESNWLMYEPTDGTVGPGGDTDVIVTLDPYNTLEGAYEADLIIASNDPATPEVIVPVTMNIEGAAVIDVQWSDANGYPEVIDWNTEYDDLFTGVEFQMSFSILSIGSAELVIDDIFVDNEYFTVAPREFIVAPRNAENVTVTFRAPEDAPGIYDPTLVIVSNAINIEQYEIPLYVHAYLPPVIVVTPNAIEDDLITGETRDRVLNIDNDGDATLRWKMTHRIISEPGRDNNTRSLRNTAGPRRDEPGELLASFAGPNVANRYWSPVGYDRENNAIFITGYNDNVVVVWTHDNYEDFREVRRFAVTQPMDGGWYNGVIYLCNLNVNTVLRRYDIEGNNLGDLAMGYSVYGLAFDNENNLMFARNNAAPNSITVYQMDGIDRGEQIGQFDDYRQFIANQAMYNLEWVPKHPEGQLWINQTNVQQMVQIEVDTDNWTAVREVQRFANGGANQPYDALTHDGYNMWVGGYGVANFRIYDDGVPEMYWVGYEPTAGELEGGADSDVIVYLNAIGMAGGHYEAELIITSNDPVNSEVIVNVTLEITAAPDIDITWKANNGYPEAVDWNTEYFDLFSGQDYQMTVDIANIGTDDLVVRDIISDNDYFTTDFNDDIILGPREKHNVIITFSVPEDEPGEQEATLTVLSNDHDEEEYNFVVRAHAYLPPVITVNPQVIRDVLMQNNQTERIITLANEGDANLRFTSRFEVLREPERDSDVRSLRHANGPVRDNPGDLIASFQGPNVANRYWMPIGYDRENNAMFISGYADNTIAVWTHDNYQDFREVRRFAVTQPMDGAWYNGVIYICNLNLNTTLRRHDIEGNNLGDLAMGFSVYGLAFDIEEGLMFARDNAAPNPIRVYEMDGIDRGAQIAQFDDYRQFIANQAMHNLEWVPRHPDGQLWINQTNVQQIVQIQVDTDNWTAVREVQRFANGGSNQGYDALTHDGYNMWIGGYAAANFRIYDDGINESYWYNYQPRKGEIAGGEETEINLTLDATNLVEGDYEGVMRFFSNDPITPVLELPVILTVGVDELTYFVNFVETEFSHVLTITEFTFDDTPLETNWGEIAVSTPEGVLAGACVWVSNGVDLHAWGAADGVDQFTQGERFMFLVWDREANREYSAQATFTQGEEVWLPNGASTLTLAAYSTRTIGVDLARGWNLISINVVPQMDLWTREEGPDVRLMTNQLRHDDGHYIELMKDESGRFYSPSWNFINIPYWNLQRGYQVKIWMNAEPQSVHAEWTGAPIPADAPITINPSWNIIAYWPTYQLEASSQSGFYVVSPIVDFVGIAKDGSGRFMVPAWNFSNMIPWREGQGYQIRIDHNEPIEFRYPQERQVAAVASVSNSSSHWTAPLSTGFNMSVLLHEIKGVKLTDDMQVAAFDVAGNIVGVGSVSDGRIGLAVWGDDPTTNEVEGLHVGEAFELRLANQSGEEINLLVSAVLEGNGLVYETDAFTVLTMESATMLPNEFYLSAAYPNPFNSLTRFTYGLPEASRVTVKVFDVMGRLVSTLVDGDREAGIYHAVWNANSASAGVYLVRMESSTGYRSVQKVMLVK